MYYPEGMKARVSPVQSIEPHRILAPTRDSNLESSGPESRVVTTILPLHINTLNCILTNSWMTIFISYSTSTFLCMMMATPLTFSSIRGVVANYLASQVRDPGIDSHQHLKDSWHIWRHLREDTVFSCNLRCPLIFLHGCSRTYRVASLRAGPVDRISHNLYFDCKHVRSVTCDLINEYTFFHHTIQFYCYHHKSYQSDHKSYTFKLSPHIRPSIQWTTIQYRSFIHFITDISPRKLIKTANAQM